MAKRDEYRKKGFYPQDYSYYELVSISRGGRPEAWDWSMRRPVFPFDEKLAKQELRHRDKRKGTSYWRV